MAAHGKHVNKSMGLWKKWHNPAAKINVNASELHHNSDKTISYICKSKTHFPQNWRKSTAKIDIIIFEFHYRQTSNIGYTKSQNLNDSRLILKLYLPNPLKPGVKSSMEM